MLLLWRGVNSPQPLNSDRFVSIVGKLMYESKPGSLVVTTPESPNVVAMIGLTIGTPLL